MFFLGLPLIAIIFIKLKNVSQAKPKKVVGRLRKTQLITTFGNGSIVDMLDYSVIMAGANYWKDSSPVLHEPNLEKLLKVSHFKEPYSTANTRPTEKSLTAASRPMPQ